MTHHFRHLGRDRTIYTRPNRPPTWYLKIAGRPLSLQTTDRDTAVRNAKLRLDQHAQGADKYQQFIDATTQRSTLTVGQIIDQWIAAGYPLPNRQPRKPSAQAAQAAQLKLSRSWWDAVPVATIKGPTLGDYAEHRRRGIQHHDGSRAVDLELTTYSNAFQWAIAKGLCDRNPFAHRPKFQNPDDVEHCPQFMPASDEELHRLIGLLFAPVTSGPRPEQVHRFRLVAGAQLLYQALTGQRPGEPAFLRLDATTTNGRPMPGQITRTAIDGQPVEFLAVHRLKNGINPAVRVHVALRAFLDHWLPVVRHHWPASPYWFPNPDRPTVPLHRDRLRLALDAARRGLDLPERTPHAMRAYYVRVRRAQGHDDGTIALELGERTGAAMIVSIYGEAGAHHGDRQFDWFPAPEAGIMPAWTLLPQVTNTVTPLSCAS